MASRILLAMMAILLAVALMGCPPPPEQPENDVAVVPPDEDVQQVDVGLGEWYVTLSPDTVHAGPVVFNITNEGDVMHALEIQNGVEARSENLSAGETATMSVNLTPGTYDAWCPIGDHRERGMETTLTVTDEE